MKYLNKEIGNMGEFLSKKYLQEKGYIILEENYSWLRGEVDIIALDNKFLCFIEVKTRYSLSYGNPCEAVTFSKKVKIIKTAEHYILNKNLHKYFCRFDILEVTFNPHHNDPSFNLIKNAFIT